MRQGVDDFAQQEFAGRTRQRADGWRGGNPGDRFEKSPAASFRRDAEEHGLPFLEGEDYRRAGVAASGGSVPEHRPFGGCVANHDVPGERVVVRHIRERGVEHTGRYAPRHQRTRCQIRRHQRNVLIGAGIAGFVLGGGIAALGALTFGRRGRDG